MAVRAVVDSITTASQVICDGTNSSAQAPQSFLVRNPTGSAGTAYVGGDDLNSTNTATAGYPIAPGDPPLEVDLFGGDKLWAVTAAGTATLQVLKVRS